MATCGDRLRLINPRSCRWYRRAAEQGLATAQYNLGGMYDLGRGVSQDGEQAAKWYIKAADRGHVKAQYRLAVMFDNQDSVADIPQFH